MSRGLGPSIEPAERRPLGQRSTAASPRTLTAIHSARRACDAPTSSSSLPGPSELGGRPKSGEATHELPSPVAAVAGAAAAADVAGPGVGGAAAVACVSTQEGLPDAA